MPYASNSDLPQAARSAYSDNCQSVFRHTWNSEYDAHKDESRAFATAHAAAKRCQGSTKAMPLPMTTFKLYAPTLIASRTTDGRMRIEGIASSTLRDHHGDQLTLNALRKMAANAIGMTIFMNHDYAIPGSIFGTVEKAAVVDSGEHDKFGEKIWDLRMGIGVAMTNKKAVETWEVIDQDKVKLGISVGAMVPEGGAKFDATKKSYIVDDADMVESSIVGIPAQPRAFVDYVVKAFAGRYPHRMNDDFRDQLARKYLDEGQASAAVEVDEEEPEFVSQSEIVEEHPDAVTPTDEHDELVKGAESPITLQPVDGVIIEAIMAEDDEDPDLNHEGVEIEFAPAHYEMGEPLLNALEPDLQAAVWSTDYKNSLPDSAFACPKERKYPHHTKSGGVDRAHLANALARQGQGNDSCGRAHLEAHAKALGMGDREKALVPDIAAGEMVAPDMAEVTSASTKARVTVWEDGDTKTIEVDTGRRPPASSPSVQETPETTGGNGTEGKTTKKALDQTGLLLASYQAQILASRLEITSLIEQRDQAIEVAKVALQGTEDVLKKIGDLPMGRKTGFVEVRKDFEDLQAIYDDDVRRLIAKH